MLLRHKQPTSVDHSGREPHQSKKLFHKWLIADVWQQWTEPSAHSCCCWYCDIIKAGTWRVLQRPSSVLRLWLPWWVQHPPPPHPFGGSAPPLAAWQRWARFNISNRSVLLRGLLQKAPFVAGQNIAISITKESTALFFFFLATDDLSALKIFMDVLTQCAPYSIN